MITGLFVLGLIVAIVQIIKEATRPNIPAENWRNKELYWKDYYELNGDMKKLLKNVANGKYK